MRWRWMVMVGLCVLSCGRGTGVSVDLMIGTPESIGALDPPYLPQVVYPSGLRLDLVEDRGLTNSYPGSEGNPFGQVRERHYARVLYFIDLARAAVAERVSANFLLSEYVTPTGRWGGTRAYVDAQVVAHMQQIRSGLGRPLIVSSAYRSPEHNRDVGGASFSRHIYGDAVDVDVDQSLTDANLRAQEIFNESRDVGVDFVLPISETSVVVNGEQRASWIHLDDRGF